MGSGYPKALRVLIIALVSCCSTLSFMAFSAEPRSSELDLNGVALFEELGEAQFLGAFYSDHPGAPAITQLVTSRDMRLELKVVNANGLNKRRLDQMWLEGLAINNSQELLDSESAAVRQFVDMVKGNLELGDHLVVESVGGRDVRVWLNGIELGSIHNSQLFTMLLSTWIGRVSLSTEFRDDLLNYSKIDPSLRARFLELNPAASRQALVKSWRQLGATAPQAEVDNQMKKSARLS